MPPDSEGSRDRHDPLAALRQPNFLIYTVSRFGSGVAMMLLQAVIAYQVFQISDSALQLGLLGLVRFVPSLSLSLISGAVADRFDRRTIIVVTTLATMACSLALMLATQAGEASLPLIYGLLFIVALAATFEAPASQALLPNLVTRDTIGNAITVGTTVRSLAWVSGPALGGLVIATASIGTAYGVHAALCLVAVLALIPLRVDMYVMTRRAISVAAIKEGVGFVWHRQALLGCMTLDLFAVVFGGATALLPIYALEILDVGAGGYGLLAASLELGALLMSLFLIFMPPIERPGRALIFAVVAFGLGTIVFGLSRSFPLTIAAYMFVGMADQLSVVMRQTTIQLATPDELRGRVSSVNMLFIGASNHLGAVESGTLAAVTSATFAVVSGGVAVLGVVGAVAAKMPQLWAYRTGGETLSPATAVMDSATPTQPPEPARPM